EPPLHAEPGARGTGAVGAVEREEPGRELRIRHAARRAGVPLAEEDPPRLGRSRLLRLDEERPAPVGERDGERVREALLDPGTDDQAVDEHLDRVARVPGEPDLLAQVAERAVDPDAYEAAAPELVELLPVLAFPVAHDGREDEEPGVGGQGHETVDDLLHRLRRDLPSARPAERPPDAGVEEPEVIRDLGEGPDRGAR